jgi:outer membrane protein assembly factor BamB
VTRARPHRRPAWWWAAVLALAVTGCGGCGGGDQGDHASSGAPSSSPQTASPSTAWEWKAPPPSYAGMPAADGDDVAATYGTIGLVLLDGSDGSVRWQTERRGLRDVAPRLAAGVVLAAADDGVVAFDRATGRVRWDSRLGERANTPVVAGGKAIVSTWEGSLVGLDLVDGGVAWRSTLPGAALGPAATDAGDGTGGTGGSGGTVVVATWVASGGRAAGAVAVEAADGRPRWAVPLEPDAVSGPAVVAAGDGPKVAVVVAGDIAAHALDLADGTERWRTDLDGAGSPEAPPLPLPGGEVLVAHRLGGLALLDVGTGSKRWTASSDGVVVRGSPAGVEPEGPFALPLDDGRVLVAAPDQESGYVGGQGRVSGVAVGSGDVLVMGTREGPENGVVALSGW